MFKKTATNIFRIIILWKLEVPNYKWLHFKNWQMINVVTSKNIKYTNFLLFSCFHLDRRVRWRQKLLQTSCIQIRVSDSRDVYVVSNKEDKQNLADIWKQPAVKPLCKTLEVTSLDKCSHRYSSGSTLWQYFGAWQKLIEYKSPIPTLRATTIVQKIYGQPTGGVCGYVSKFASIPLLSSIQHHVIGSAEEIWNRYLKEYLLCNYLLSKIDFVGETP